PSLEVSVERSQVPDSIVVSQGGASSLHRLTCEKRVNRGGSDAPGSVYHHLPRRVRARRGVLPAAPAAEGPRAQMHSRRPADCPVLRLCPDPFPGRRLLCPARPPLGHGGPQRLAGPPAPDQRATAPPQPRPARRPAQGLAPPAAAPGHRPDPGPLPRRAPARPQGGLPL